MMKIAVISDTHGYIGENVINIIKECDAVIHAGDIDTSAACEELRAAADTRRLYIVRGNCDRGVWADALPAVIDTDIGGYRVFVVHNKAHIPDGTKADIFICGHSHKYAQRRDGGTLHLNPGSCGKRRFGGAVTMAVITLSEDGIEAERIQLGAAVNAAGDTVKTVRDVMKRMDRGEDIDAVSRAMGISRSFAEQIARIRVTHPGVDAEGIVNKMEVNSAVNKSKR